MLIIIIIKWGMLMKVSGVDAPPCPAVAAWWWLRSWQTALLLIIINIVSGSALCLVGRCRNSCVWSCVYICCLTRLGVITTAARGDAPSGVLFELVVAL
jgi:hypothetical protein